MPATPAALSTLTLPYSTCSTCCTRGSRREPSVRCGLRQRRPHARRCYPSCGATRAGAWPSSTARTYPCLSAQGCPIGAAARGHPPSSAPASSVAPLPSLAEASLTVASSSANSTTRGAPATVVLSLYGLSGVACGPWAWRCGAAAVWTNRRPCSVRRCRPRVHKASSLHLLTRGLVLRQH